MLIAWSFIGALILLLGDGEEDTRILDAMVRSLVFHDD